VIVLSGAGQHFSAGHDIGTAEDREYRVTHGHARTDRLGAFKDMREIKRLEDELVRSERLAAVGQTAAGIAHGVKNILHGMKLGAFMIDTGFEKDKGESLRKGWNLVSKNINRISKMTQEMLSLASTTPPAFELCSINEIVDEVCELMTKKATELGISLVRELDPSLPQMTVDPDGLYTCLVNLVTNAIEAFPKPDSGGRVIVSSSDAAEGGICLRVRDTGQGMSEEIREQVFENLFTTKGARGTGLGLAITQKIVHEHGGSIQVESEPNKGSSFAIVLPKEGRES